MAGGRVTENRKPVESWRDLEVWQLAHRLVLKVYEITRDFTPEERFRLTDQLCRAAALFLPTFVREKAVAL